MKIIIEAEAKEIAALATLMQGQPVTNIQEVKKVIRTVLKELDCAVCSLISALHSDPQT